MTDALLELKDLSVDYGSLPALRGVSMTVRPGEILGVVGESGSGKSTAIHAAMGLLGPGGRVTGGSVRFDGRELSALSREELRRLRGRELALIAQSPADSFHPARRVRSQLHELARCHGLSRKDAEERMLELLARMNLREGKKLLDSYAFELSGGMCQRAAIALAMTPGPRLLLADEPTSALDTVAQAQVVRELLRVREDCGAAILMVSHNMGVIARAADRIAVMCAGTILEYGAAEELLRRPRHPYTRDLIRAVPRLGAPVPAGIRASRRSVAAGSCPLSGGCEGVGSGCRDRLPPLMELAEGHWTRCRLTEGTA